MHHNKETTFTKERILELNSKSQFLADVLKLQFNPFPRNLSKVFYFVASWLKACF